MEKRLFQLNFNLPNEVAKKIQALKDAEVLTQAEELVREERRVTTELLCYFRELERRMLYVQQGYPSLYDMLVRHFHYSTGAAYRRLAAMRLLTDMPEVEQKISDGSLSLSTAAKLQTFFRDTKLKRLAPMSIEEKREVINQVESKSTREVESVLLQISPESIPRDRVRPLTETLTEIRLIIDEILKDKLDHLKNLLSHKLPVSEYKDVISEASDIAIEKLEPALRKLLRDAQPAPAPQSDVSEIGELEGPLTKGQIAGESLLKKQLFGDHSQQKQSSGSSMLRETIPAHIKRAIWARDGGSCSFRLNESSPRCGSRYRVVIDHIIPVAKGGKAEIGNLRLLCETHNLFEAKRVFGLKHMSQFVDKFCEPQS